MNSTLALNKTVYESEVGDYLGWGRTAWQSEAEKVTRLQLDVASGLRRFYYCGHPWSFLKPFAQLTLPQGATTVPLPDDFGGVDGGTQACLTNTNLLFLQWLPFTGPGRVLQALSELPNAVGITRLLSERPIKGMQPGQMQKSELYFFPEADQAYTLTFPYFFNPEYLVDVTYPFALGGVEHHDTILESCLAVAEARRDNLLKLHSSEFQRLLQLSIQIDRRKQPTNLGQNLDRSDGVNWWEKWNGHGWSNNGGGVTINGTFYS